MKTDLFDAITLEVEKVDALADLIEDTLAARQDVPYGLIVAAQCIRDRNRVLVAKARTLWLARGGVSRKPAA